jgi:hypothetical protein
MLYVHVLLTIGITQGTIRTIASLNNNAQLEGYLVTTYYRGGMATISQTTYTWMHDGAIRAALMTYRIPSQNRLRAGRCECYVGLPAGSSKWGSISSC